MKSIYYIRELTAQLGSNTSYLSEDLAGLKKEARPSEPQAIKISAVRSSFFSQPKVPSKERKLEEPEPDVDEKPSPSK